MRFNNKKCVFRAKNARKVTKNAFFLKNRKRIHEKSARKNGPKAATCAAYFYRGIRMAGLVSVHGAAVCGPHSLGNHGNRQMIFKER